MGNILKEILIKGSKEEKISIIIKIWINPLKALKAISLFNLKSYNLIKNLIYLSQNKDIIGFKKYNIK